MGIMGSKNSKKKESSKNPPPTYFKGNKTKNQREIILERYPGGSINEFLKTLTFDELQIITKLPVKRGDKYSNGPYYFKVYDLNNDYVQMSLIGEIIETKFKGYDKSECHYFSYYL